MAIYGVGIDLVQVNRHQEILNRWGKRFESRVFTERESGICAGRKNQASCLAMRFAAKEAFVKALGTGMRAPLRWLDIEIRNNELGKPEIFLSERALRFCREHGIRGWHVSLTDDGQYGAAVVVLEC
ncbi:MAG: holo-ACP synthase [Desulforhabdus sp.]|jgi:holo-[acyl-carrier protein] synthase|nr:holo-ACP synthase [Desulforhabdus sp.]